MSRVIQNLSLAVPQKHGADWANNTAETGAYVRTREERMAMHKALDEWIHGRTYNKGEMASVDGKFYAINNHVHFRFLNTDKQSELAIREVRRDVYEALSTRFGVTKNSDTLLALQEFLFGSTTVREPLTCDEVYSLLRLINKTRDGSGNERFQEVDYDPKEHALQKATYGQLVKFMETARKVKHTNMTTAELDALSVNVGGLKFTAADFIKGYGKHDSVRKTTVNVNCYNDLLETEKEVRNGLMEDVRGHLNRLGDAVQKLEDLRKDVENLKAKLNSYLSCQGNAKSKIQAPIAALELRAAIDAVKTNLEGSEEMKLERGGLIFELNSLRSNLDKGLELDRTVPDSLLSQVSNAYEEAHGSLVSIQKASAEGRCLPLVGLKSAGLDKQMDYLLSRAELFYKTGSKNKGIGEGLEFYKSLAADGHEMPAIDKLLHLEDRLWRLLAEHVDGMPEVRRQPVLRELLIELGKRSVREALNTLAEVQVKTTDEYSPWTRMKNKIVDVSSLIQEKANAFTYLMALFSPEVMDRLVRSDLKDLLDGESADSAPLLERLGMLDRLLRTKGDTMTGLTGRLNALNNHLTGQYGESFPKPEGSDDLDKMLVEIKGRSLAAKRRSADFANYLRDNGFSQEEIDRAFANGKLHGAAVLLADGDFRAEALKVVRRKCPDLASRLPEPGRGDEALLVQMRSGLQRDVRERIQGALGLDDKGLDVRVDVLVQDPEESVRNANNFRQAFTRTLKDLGLYDLADRTLLGDILKYAMFASHMDMDKFVAKVVKGVYGSGYGNVVRRLLCGLRVRIAELKFRIELCRQFVVHGRLEQTKPRKANRDEVDSAKGVGFVFSTIVWDTKDSGTIFEDMYKALEKVRRDSAEVLGDELVRKVEWYVEQMQELDSRVKRWFAVLTGEDANLGLQVDVMKSESINGLETGGSDFVTVIQVSDPRVENGEVRVDVSREDIMAKLKADLADLAGKSINEGGAVIGAPTIGSVLDPK